MGPARMPAVGDLVLVEWLDIQTDTGWQSLKELDRPAPCKTVGFVVHTEAAWIGLAASLGVSEVGPGHNAESNLRQSIPWGCVSDWRLLVPRRPVRK